MIAGYKIINLQNINMTVDSGFVVVPGIYERLEGNYNRATMLCGITIGNVEYDNRYVAFGKAGRDYVAVGSADGTTQLKLTVTPEDHVTLTTIA